MIDLREYQHELSHKAWEDMLNGGAPVVTLSTGGGKTVIIAEKVRLAVSKGYQVLVIAHRLSIVMQIAASIKKHMGYYPQLITRGYTSPLAPVTVAMYQTLSRREEWIQRLKHRVFIVDEAHHMPAPSYIKLKQKLQPIMLAGDTATPVKPNGGAILDSSKHFSHLLIGPPPQWLMDQGFICKYDYYGSDEEIDTAGLKFQANGELSEKEHEERVLRISGSVVPDWFKYNPNREKTICVGVTVNHAEQLVKLYVAAGVRAKLVTGKTKQAERDKIFHEFEHGNLEVIVSVALIDEGLDIPVATCLQLPRVIGSIRLFRQLGGRVLRTAPGKERAIIIDHGGTWKRLALFHKDITWPTTPKEKATAKVKANEFVKKDDNGRIVIVNMLETKSELRLITDEMQERAIQKNKNPLAGMTAKERAEFFREQNPVKTLVGKWEQHALLF